ncbi:MAG: SufE family protein [Alphaproteobacteria bacterium]|nr:SufE family protein [Alphaproteobacteria bacterium]
MAYTLHDQAVIVRQNFEFLDSWEEKYQYIIDLGKSLSVMDESAKTEKNRVRGCMSQVWMCVERTQDGINLIADSDAVIVRGLIALVRNLVQGQPPDVVAGFDFIDFFQQLGLDRQLSPNRRNGLVAFVRHLQKSIN